MFKYITCIILLIAYLITNARTSYAQDSMPSATFAQNEANNIYDYRVANLKQFLNKYNSPLGEYAEDFVLYADKYALDYRLVPAITGVESTFGKRIPKNSFNAYGWANGNYKFNSWPESISTVSAALRTKYIDTGADTVYEIGRIYAPPSTTWAGNVVSFMNKIDHLPVGFDI